ncbi:MAG: outer membrane lipoprotein carrier protein LolA [Gemmatimonadota bacterium]
MKSQYLSLPTRSLRLSIAPMALAAALLMSAGAPELAAQDARSVLERASARHDALEGFCADFAQEIEVTLLRETVRSRGELCQARSDHFEMRWTDPAGDRIVADGTYLWVYFPSSDEGMVSRTRMAGIDGSFDLHREFLSDPGERYAATHEGMEEVDGRAVHVLHLTPQVPTQYRDARVWIDAEEFLIRKLVIEEAETESIRTIQLSGIRLNPVLPADRFAFVPPPGVQVITR